MKVTSPTPNRQGEQATPLPPALPFPYLYEIPVIGVRPDLSLEARIAHLFRVSVAAAEMQLIGLAWISRAMAAIIVSARVGKMQTAHYEPVWPDKANFIFGGAVLSGSWAIW
jgi:hypothetical protein